MFRIGLKDGKRSNYVKSAVRPTHNPIWQCRNQNLESTTKTFPYGHHVSAWRLSRLTSWLVAMEEPCPRRQGASDRHCHWAEVNDSCPNACRLDLIKGRSQRLRRTSTAAKSDIVAKDTRGLGVLLYSVPRGLYVCSVSVAFLTCYQLSISVSGLSVDVRLGRGPAGDVQVLFRADESDIERRERRAEELRDILGAAFSCGRTTICGCLRLRRQTRADGGGHVEQAERDHDESIKIEWRKKGKLGVKRIKCGDCSLHGVRQKNT